MPRPMVCVLLALAPMMVAALRKLDLGGELRNVSEPKCNLDSVPKFILNLHRRPDRLAKMDSHFREVAPFLLKNMCRVGAPDGKAFSKSMSPSLVFPMVWQKVLAERGSHRLVHDEATVGVLACAMGHGLVWEHVLRESAPWSIVFEDDVELLHPGIADFLCRVQEGKEETLRHGWEYVQMQMVRKYKRDDASPLHAVPGTDFHTGMYLITREAAARMLNLSFPLSNHQLDSSGGALRTKLKGFMTLPKAADQEGDWGGHVRDTDAQWALDHDLKPGMRNCRPLRKRSMVKPELLDVYAA